MTIKEFLTAYGNRNKISIVYYPKDETEQTQTIVPSTVVEMYLKNHYKSWEMFTDSAEESLAQFQTYNRIMACNLKRTLEAMEMEYNPIENYDGHEQTTNVYGQYGEFNTKGSQLNRYDYGEATTTATDGVTTNDLNTFNDTAKATSTADARHDELDEGERIDEKRIDTHTDTITVHKHGNMGVKTTQSVLLEEIALRNKNVIFEYIDTMAHDLWAYVGGCD